MDKTSDVLLKKRFYVYTLFSLKDKKLYTSFTTNLKKDLQNMLKDYQKQQDSEDPFYLFTMSILLMKLMRKQGNVFLKAALEGNN